MVTVASNVTIVTPNIGRKHETSIQSVFFIPWQQGKYQFIFLKRLQHGWWDAMQCGLIFTLWHWYREIWRLDRNCIWQYRTKHNWTSTLINSAMHKAKYINETVHIQTHNLVHTYWIQQLLLHLWKATGYSNKTI